MCTVTVRAVRVASLLLIHSPLLGPSSLRRLAATAAETGLHVAVPDLTAIGQSQRPTELLRELALAAVPDLTPPIALVGHSGAGPFLPSIAAGITGPTGLVFVDAVVPAKSGNHRPSAELLALLHRNCDADGLLSPWLDWWPQEVLAAILPDPADRNQLAADCPRLPLHFYEVSVRLPPDWWEQPCGFVGLSAAYEYDRAAAIDRGWPVRQLASDHLAVHTDPVGVFDAVTEVIAEMVPPQGDATKR